MAVLGTMVVDGSKSSRRHDDPPPLPLGAGTNPLDLRGAWPSDSARLLVAAKRALSMPRSRAALLLRLSALPPSLPRPHHRRIAWTILEESARSYRGETFDLPSGDLVLLCQLPRDYDGELHPAGLPKVFARLFRADVPATTVLTTIWPLERDGAALLSYISMLES